MAVEKADRKIEGKAVSTRRTFSIERHLRRAESAEMAFDLGAGAEAGTMAALLDEIKGLRGEMGDLRDQLAGAVAANAALPAHAPAPIKAAPMPGPDTTLNGADSDEEWKKEAQLLRVEVARMVRSLAATKREIAEIKHPMRSQEEDRMTKAASELDEIVSATEQATNDILDASEKISSHAVDVLGEIGDMDALTPRMQDINEQVARIMEACNFQDITGQRVTKVVKTLEFIEDRIRTIVDDWGRESFLDLPLPDDDEEDDPHDESKLLNGPQLSSNALCQDDIDALFD